MYARIAQLDVVRLLNEQAAVALLGPRQVGKTTLALEIGATRPSVYFDLERPEDAAMFAEPRALLERHADKLVIIDEVQRAPDLFKSIRGLIDAYRRDDNGVGKFLFLGSASIDLLRQSSESLAGRIAYRELGPLNSIEVGATSPSVTDALWARGGFPDSYSATTERGSLTWRRDFIRTYLERDIPQFDSRVPAETLRRFWTMLAHNQGALLNASALATSLSINVRTLQRYLDLLVDLLLVRRLQPWAGNVQKRLVRSPKTYLRDSGLVHALLSIGSLDDLLGHPIVGMSWEGFVIENLLSAAPEWAQASFYRTQAGSEIDLVLEFSPTRRWAIEIKRSASNAKPSKGFHLGCDDLNAERRLCVYAGTHAYPQPHSVETLPVIDLMRELHSLT